jgi:hypothetical protein
MIPPGRRDVKRHLEILLNVGVERRGDNLGEKKIG